MQAHNLLFLTSYGTFLRILDSFLLGTNEIYKKQVTSNCEYSWWMKDGVQKEPWTHNDRHARVNSEMTR